MPVTVYRQKVVGKYIVDFYCADVNLVIELDGSQHYEAKGLAEDKERDEYLQAWGIAVVRYSNFDIHKRFEAVCADLLKRLAVE